MKITETIPYPKTFLGLTYYKRTTFHFHFGMGALYALCEGNNIDYSQAIDMMNKDTTRFFSEAIYYSALYYSRVNYKKPTYTKNKLIQGFSQLPEETQKAFVNKIAKAMSEGVRDMKGQKKKKNQ